MEKSGQDEIRIQIMWAPTSAFFLKSLCIFENNSPADFFSKELTHHQNKEKLFFHICMMDIGSDKMFLSHTPGSPTDTSMGYTDFSKQGNGDYCGKYSNGVFGDEPNDHE